VQVAAWPDGTLADVSASVPGRRHDSAALRLVGWADQITGARQHNPDLALVADSAYGAHTDWAARPKPANEPRPAEDVRSNRAIASFPRPRRTHNRAAQAVAHPLDRLPRTPDRHQPSST
jgi:hypothetical protein